MIYVWIWKWWLQPRNPILPCRYIFPYTHRKTKQPSVFLIVWIAINNWHDIFCYIGCRFKGKNTTQNFLISKAQQLRSRHITIMASVHLCIDFACILQEGWHTFLLKKYSLLNIHTWFDRGVLAAWSQISLRCYIWLKTTAYDSHHFDPHETIQWFPTPTPCAWPLSLWKNPFSSALKCFFVG